jgi:hypothetical protein
VPNFVSVALEGEGGLTQEEVQALIDIALRERPTQVKLRTILPLIASQPPQAFVETAGAYSRSVGPTGERLNISQSAGGLAGGPGLLLSDLFRLFRLFGHGNWTCVAVRIHISNQLQCSIPCDVN